jgi:hypothetical protein
VGCQKEKALKVAQGGTRQTSMISQVLTSVPANIGNILSIAWIAVVAIFLLFATGITYYYWRKNKRMKAAVTAAA